MLFLALGASFSLDRGLMMSSSSLSTVEARHGADIWTLDLDPGQHGGISSSLRHFVMFLDSTGYPSIAITIGARSFLAAVYEQYQIVSTTI